MNLPRINAKAVALGDALTAALEQAANGGEIAPIIHAADQIIADLYIGTRDELVSMMLFRLQLASGFTLPSPYYDLSARLVEEAVCTAGEMKAAVCGTLLMRGQQQIAAATSGNALVSERCWRDCSRVSPAHRSAMPRLVN